MTTEAKPADMKEKYMQFQVLQQQIEQISQHVEQLNQQNVELDISSKAVEKLAESALNTEMLAAIANGIFVKGELKDNNTLIVNVGSNVTVEKTVPEVVELLNSQRKKITAKIVEADAVLKELSDYAMKIYKEVEAGQ